MISRPVAIAVFGGSDARAPHLAMAEEVGRLLARAQATLVCGGLGGVMEAACRGANAEGGLTVGILPGYESRNANPFVRVAIPTGLGHARNAIVAAAGDAAIAIDGAEGTLSEIALALQLGRGVVGLATPELPGTWIARGRFRTAATPAEAVRLALDLARA